MERKQEDKWDEKDNKKVEEDNEEKNLKQQRS